MNGRMEGEMEGQTDRWRDAQRDRSVKKASWVFFMHHPLYV